MRLRRVVVMGVSGCGKSTVGEQLAALLDLPFIEGDRLHSARNVALMASGTPLTDDDRADWLDAVAQSLQAASGGAVASCSALRRRYRDRLRQQVTGLRFVHLTGPRELLQQRLRHRPSHYMPASLLDSQLATLEPPAPEEAIIELDIALPPEVLAQQAAQALQDHPIAAAHRPSEEPCP